MDSPEAILRRVFGYGEFRSMQREVIDSVLQRRDNFVLMPTGGGKSMCYQLPALLLDGTAIVVSPLISLMKDQVDALRENGISAAFLNSSLKPGEAEQVLSDLAGGALKLLYVAPERAMAPEFTARLRRAKLSLVAIDEAHCVSQWGHDFRPEYVQLGQLRDALGDVPFIALTATADAQTRSDVAIRLRLRDPALFVSGFDRPNIRYRVVPKDNPRSQLFQFLADREGESGIVYCLSRKRVDSVSQDLRKSGVRAAAYHAGMDSRARGKVQEAFQKDEVDVVVATVAFGMGIDKPNVRFVVHYDMPKNVEGYYQETGRAGRDGLPSEALLLYGSGDAVLARRLIGLGENPEQKKIELQKLKSMVSFAEAVTCRRQLLLSYFGEQDPPECGNCDVCLTPPGTYDATEDVKQILMTVYGLGQRFGAKHAVDVLRGAETAKIAQFGHDRLGTYGTGTHFSAAEWMALIRQLLQQEILLQDAEAYSALKLTPKTRPILREGQRVELVKPAARQRRSRRGERQAALGPDEELFQALRALRKRLADEAQVPPYVVFGDAALRDMAAKKPRTRAQMLDVSGVGQHKLDRYGKVFLEAISEFARANGT